MEIKIFNFTGYEDECEVSYFDGESKYLKTLFLTDLDLTLYYDKRQETHKVTINSVKSMLFNRNDEHGANYILDNFEIFEIQHEMVGYIDWEEWEENKLVDDNFLD
jgi:hypothetical protein